MKISAHLETAYAVSIFSPVSLLTSFGAFTLLGVLLIVFIENGVLFPLLPGDALLFTVGLVAANKSEDLEPFAPLWLILITISLAAFLGGMVGYFIGAKYGASLFKPQNKVLKYKYLEQSHQFFNKYGSATVIVARFVPIVRTYASVAAGIGKMDRKVFIIYNAVGAVIWTLVVVLAGYYFGNIPFIRDNIEAIFIGIVLLSIIPIIWAALQAWRAKR